ncbi:MAG: PD-(D/E)XK nuclease family protein [Candidatus Midichloria sp.]|nr:MAG: PD-(D/E)XK nuclease family protein [Candidatus Midichloria sp.]
MNEKVAPQASYKTLKPVSQLRHSILNIGGVAESKKKNRGKVVTCRTKQMDITNFEFGSETFLKVSNFLNNLNAGTVIVDWAIAKNLNVDQKHTVITSNSKVVFSQAINNIYLVLPNFGIDWNFINAVTMNPKNKIFTIGYGEKLEFTSVFKIEGQVVNFNKQKMLELLFSSNKDFLELQGNKALLKEKFNILNAKSKVDESEQIADFIVQNPKKKIAIMANQEIASILDVALSARKIKFHNGVNKKFTIEEKNFLKIAYYLSKKEINETSDIKMMREGVNIIKIKALHQEFQKSECIQEMFEINLRAYEQITQEIFHLKNPELENFELLGANYFELFLNLLGNKGKYAGSNIVIVNINDIINNFDFCIFTHITLEEYYQLEKKTLEFLTKQEIKTVLAYKIAANIFCNKEVYVSYNTNINNILYWFELIHKLLECSQSTQNEYREEIQYRSPVIAVNKEDLPKEISVTAVEKLIRDPYLYYINHILGLKMPKLSEEEDLEKLFGIVLHEILSIMVYKFKAESTEYISQFIAITRDILAKYNLTSPMVHHLWVAKFEKIAHWFWQYESSVVFARDKILTEVESWMIINLAQDTNIKLSAQIDRIDVMKDGSIHIIDYKSGNLPSNKDIATGLSPQMPLEALIVKNGYINGGKMKVQNGKLRLYYLHLTGRHNIGSVKEIEYDLGTTQEQLTKLLHKFWIDSPRFFFNNTDNKSYQADYYRHFVRFNEY